MKRLKNILCLLLVFTFSICLVGCNEDNSDIKKPPKKPEVSTTVQTLSTVSSIMMEKLDGGEDRISGHNYFSDDVKGTYFYDTFIYGALAGLDEISKIKNLKENTILSGEKITIENPEDKGFDLDYVNKIEALYITNKVSGNETALKVYILGARESFATNKFNATIYYYDIAYNSLTKAVKLHINIGKTTSNIEDGYVGTIFSFYYDSSVDHVICNKFNKIRHYDASEDNLDLETDIIANTMVYGQIYFFVTSGSSESFPSETTNADVQATIASSVLAIDKAYSEIFKIIEDNKTAGEGTGAKSGEETETTITIPESLVYILNSTKPEDFESKLYGAVEPDTGNEPDVVGA